MMRASANTLRVSNAIMLTALAVTLLVMSAGSAIKVEALKKNIADVDRDGLNEEYDLDDGVMRIVERGMANSANGHVLWHSPKEWRVQDFAVADVTNDGTPDILLSVWKAGNFGPSKPFWVRENDMSIKNHLFVFELVDDALRPQWQSSNLEAPNCGIAVADADGDGDNDLLAAEGVYGDESCLARYDAVWSWNGWGFSNESRVKR